MYVDLVDLLRLRMAPGRDIITFVYSSRDTDKAKSVKAPFKGYALSAADCWNMTSLRGQHNPATCLKNCGSGRTTYKGDT